MTQKRIPYRNKKIIASARGEQCNMRLSGVCRRWLSHKGGYINEISMFFCFR